MDKPIFTPYPKPVFDAAAKAQLLCPFTLNDILTQMSDIYSSSGGTSSEVLSTWKSKYLKSVA